MKKLLIAAMIVLAQVGGAWAQTVPKKFQGNWVSIIDNDYKALTKIGTRTIDPGSGDKFTISKIAAADEDGNLLVTYKPTCSPPQLPCPNALPVILVLKLVKLKGRETLITVNEESPVNIWIMQRTR